MDESIDVLYYWADYDSTLELLDIFNYMLYNLAGKHVKRHVGQWRRSRGIKAGLYVYLIDMRDLMYHIQWYHFWMKIYKFSQNTIITNSLFQIWHGWENILLCLIIIIKSEVWTIIHCLGLVHETMVCAVCLFMFLWINDYGDTMQSMCEWLH